jgi:hypothetical protein
MGLRKLIRVRLKCTVETNSKNVSSESGNYRERRFRGCWKDKLLSLEKICFDVTQHRLVVSYRRFGTTYRPHL